jgi:membrane protein required for colicin V production
MNLTGLDIVVLIVIGGAAVLGAIRGFVTEVLALLAWLLVVLALKLFQAPLSELLTSAVGTAQGGAVLAFAILAGATYFGGRMVARTIGGRIRDSFLGPIDRALGLGFGALKGLVVVSVVFLLVVLVFDTVGGGPKGRPAWITGSVTYPLLDRTSAGIADFVDRRRHGRPVLDDGNATAPAEADEAPARRR